MKIDVIDIIADVLYTQARYKALFGGRGSGKSWSIADYVIQRNAFHPVRGLCTREFQGSIRDSVFRLLCDRIYFHKLQSFFNITRDSIVGKYGSEIIFKGLRTNTSEIKSTEGLDWVWVEEAEKVSEESWDILLPTVRKENSEVLISFNPEDETAATYRRFIEKDGKPVELPGLKRAFVNYWNNPWFPEVLRREMEWCRVNDPEKYDHIWGGRPKKYGNAVIFKTKLKVEEFETPEGVQFFFGCDFGYSVDPTCLVRMFMQDKKLYIDYEAYGVGIEIEELPGFFKSVPGYDRWKVTCDSARPETISYLTRQGINATGAEKGKGSVEDGIEFLKNFEAIIIHPRCKGSIDDFSNYRWKQDRFSGDILPIPLDLSNHACDAARYALEGWIKGQASIYDVL